MATMLAAPGGQAGSSSGASGSGFGAHPGMSSSSSTSSTPSLQTLSGAMAMAMEGSSTQHGGGLYGGSAGLGGGFPSSSMNSLGDAMGMSPYKPHGGGNSSSLLYKGSSALNEPSSASSNTWGMDSLGGDVYGAQEPQHEVIVDGALELSAVAKPFVPRFGSAALGGGGGGVSSTLSSNAANTLGSASPLTGPLSGPLSGPLGQASPLSGPLSSAFGGPLSSSALGGLNLSSGLSGGLTGSPWGSSSSLNMDAVKHSSVDSQSNISSYLSNLLSSDLNLDEDNYEYGDASNIIPDLDSFLLNDN